MLSLREKGVTELEHP